MAITVRAATFGDYDDLCALSDQVDALHRNNLGHLFQMPLGHARDREYIQSLIINKEVGLFVAEAARVLIGFVHIAIRDTPPVPILVARRYAVVENLVVDRGFRRAGVGRALMERAHRWAAGQGASEVELTVYDFNQTACTFYESLGYETLSRQMCLPLEQDQA